ncbi:MAG: response regulator [Anaerolineales bacterium]|nr:response regulator [Anaerolineales bacterium]
MDRIHNKDRKTEPRILLVDDDPSTRTTLALVLEKKDLNVVTVGTGGEALEKAREGYFNLVLLDIRLPDMEGVELIAPLKEINRNTDVLMITGYATVGTAIEALNRGAAGYITKPVNIDELFALIQKTLEKQNLEEEKRQAEAQRDATMEALRKERDFAESLIETAQAIVLVLDPEGWIVRFNPFLEQVSGYRLEEVKGKDWISTFLPGDKQKNTREMLEKALHDSPTKGNIDPIITKDGQIKLIDWYDKTLKDKQGNTIGLLAVGQDVTDRIQADKEIRHHIGQLQALLEIDKALISVLDLKQMLDVILEKLETVIPYDSAAIFLHSGGRASVAAARGHPDLEETLRISFPITEDILLNDILEKKQPLVLQDAKVDERFLSRGSTDYVRSWIGVPLAAGESVIGFLTIDHRQPGVYHEEHAATAQAFAGQVAIAIQKADLLERSREQARQMQEIMDTVPEGMLVLDNAGRVVLANPTAERYLARMTDNRKGEQITQLGDRLLDELLSPPREGLWHQVNAGGRTYQVTARPLQGGPDKGSSVLVLQDITRERELQQRVQQQERMAAVGQLAAGIAHDFNNLMAVIVLNCQMALRLPQVPAKAQEKIKIAVREVGKATDLINQILDFSRLSPLEQQQMNLLVLIKEQVKLLERTIPENIRIELSYDSNEYLVNTDPTRIQQVMMNLIVNARDAMLGQEGGTVRINLAEMILDGNIKCPICGTWIEPGKKWTQLTVSDNGAGIPADVLPHIFEPFFTTKPRGEGTGLGLAQVFGIIKQHNGHINVTSKVGQGTTFTIILPQTTAPEAPAAMSPNKAILSGKGQTLLVVEDNQTVREALAVGLGSIGYKVFQAESGDEALTILHDRLEDIALVLTDMVMPNMGGAGFIYALRQQGIMLPIVAMSGYVMEEKREELEKLGSVTFLQKPSELGKISQVVAQALGNW